MLDPIFETQSKIAKVVDEIFRCSKKGKKAVKQTTLEIFFTKTVQNSNLDK
jgi:hypothetical protein